MDSNILIICQDRDYNSLIQAMVKALGHRYGADHVIVVLDQDISSSQLTGARVVLVVMSERWFVVRGGKSSGEYLDFRLDQEGDDADLVLGAAFRRALSSALQTHNAVVPLLLNDFSMPPKDLLDGEIARLADLQAYDLDSSDEEDRFEVLILRLAWLLEPGSQRLRFAKTLIIPYAMSLGSVVLAVLFLSHDVVLAALFVALGVASVPVWLVYGIAYFVRRKEPRFAGAFAASILLILGGGTLLEIGIQGSTLGANIETVVGLIALFLGIFLVPSLTLFVYVAMTATILLTRNGLSKKTSEDGLPNRFFISYRRADSPEITGKIAINLIDLERDLFWDYYSITQGGDFSEAIERALRRSGVVLVVIGPRWSSLTDNEGKRRIDDPDDFVRREIATALGQHKLVVPLLVEGAHLPGATELPVDLTPLATLRAFPIRSPEHQMKADLTSVLRYANDQLGVVLLPKSAYVPIIGFVTLIAGFVSLLFHVNLAIAAVIHYMPWTCNDPSNSLCLRWNNLDGLQITLTLIGTGIALILLLHVIPGILAMIFRRKWRLLALSVLFVSLIAGGLTLLAQVHPSPQVGDLSAAVQALISAIIALTGFFGVGIIAGHSRKGQLRVDIADK